MKLLNKQGQAMNQLIAFVYGVAAIAVTIGIVLFVLQQMQYATTSDGTSTGTATNASNAIGTMITKLAQTPVWVGIIIVVVFATTALYFFNVGR